MALRRTAKGERIRVRLLFAADNRQWVRNRHRFAPVWIGGEGGNWELPRSWSNDFVDRAFTFLSSARMDAQAAVTGIRARWRAATSAFNQTCPIADEVGGPGETRAHLAARRERRHSRGSASLGTSAGSDPGFPCETIAGRRSTSRLRKLMEYLLSRGVVSAGMIANELGVTPRGAQSLVGKLGLCEASESERHRACGIMSAIRRERRAPK